MKKVIVIGGGAAGLFFACNVSSDLDVTVIEKNDRPGRKLSITGKGRCNITNSIDISEFIENIPGNGNFLYSALYTYTNLDVIEFFEKYGVNKVVYGHLHAFDKGFSMKFTKNKIDYYDLTFVLSGSMTYHRSVAEGKVWPCSVERFIDEEVLLLPTEVRSHTLHLGVKVVAHLCGCLVHGVQCLEEGSLVVESLTGI